MCSTLFSWKPKVFYFFKSDFLNYQRQKLWTSHPHNIFSTPHTHGTHNWNISFLKFVNFCNWRTYWTFTRIRLNFLISTTHTGTGAHNDNPRHIVLENFHPWAHGAWEGHCRGEEKFSNMSLSTPKLIFLQTMCSFDHSLCTSFISKSSWLIMHILANFHTCRLEQQQNYTQKITCSLWKKLLLFIPKSSHVLQKKQLEKAPFSHGTSTTIALTDIHK